MKKKIKDFLLDSKFFYAVLGFVVGAIVPVWFLIDKNPGVIGDFGEWVGVIATFSAVVVSLYLASKKDSSDIEVNLIDYDLLLGGYKRIYEIVNVGNSSTSVKMEIGFKDHLKENKDGYENENERIKAFASLTELIDYMIIDDKSGNVIKPTDRIFIQPKDGLSIRFDPKKIRDWFENNGHFEGEYWVFLYVYTVNGNKIREFVQMDEVKYKN